MFLGYFAEEYQFYIIKGKLIVVFHFFNISSLCMYLRICENSHVAEDWNISGRYLQMILNFIIFTIIKSIIFKCKVKICSKSMKLHLQQLLQPNKIKETFIIHIFINLKRVKIFTEMCFYLLISSIEWRSCHVLTNFLETDKKLRTIRLNWAILLLDLSRHLNCPILIFITYLHWALIMKSTTLY